MDLTKIFLGFLFLIAAYCYQSYQRLSKNLPKPDFDLNEFWGKGDVKEYKEDASIKPFKISFSKEVNFNDGKFIINADKRRNFFKVINKLKLSLDDSGPFTDPLEGVAFENGFNSKRLQEILNYWKNSYIPKWSERQEFLNQFRHFKTQIQGLNIHFIHVKPKVKEGTKVFPLLVRTKIIST